MAKKRSSLKRLFDHGTADDYHGIYWQVFMSFLGSPDCAKLDLQDRVLIVNLFRYIDKWLVRKCMKEDERLEKVS